MRSLAFSAIADDIHVYNGIFKDTKKREREREKERETRHFL